MSAPVGVPSPSGAGATAERALFGCKGPYDLNDVQGWGEARWLWGGGVGGWGQPQRTALNTISISPQNSFCEPHTWRLVSSKSLRAINAVWALPVYPVFDDGK